MFRQGFGVLIFSLGMGHTAYAQTDSPNDHVEPMQTRIGLIIDDLGYSLKQGRRAIQLPGAITYSILPGTPFTEKLSYLAKTANKEIILHLPMQGSIPDKEEPFSLSSNMNEIDFRATLQEHLNSVPDAVGVNNHMGSILTCMPQQMDWLMSELSRRSLYFVDSRTTSLSVAVAAAGNHAVPFSQRDVFLDNKRDYESIESAFEHLIKTAQHRGYAIGIAHAHPATLAALEELLPQLEKRNIRLQPLSQLVLRNTILPENTIVRDQTSPATGQVIQ